MTTDPLLNRIIADADAHGDPLCPEDIRELLAEVERSQAITLQWMNSYEQMRAAGADLLADNARLAEKVARVEVLHVREVRQRQVCHGDNAEGVWLCAECLGEYPCATARVLADPTTEETT